jgi:hypothetical protein
LCKHSLLLLEDKTGVDSQIYQKISFSLSEGFAVIYIVEADPVQTLERMIQGDVKKAKESIESGALTLVDRNSFYLSAEGRFNQKPIESITDLYKSLSAKFKGVLPIGMPLLPSHPDMSDYQNLMVNENLADITLQESDEIICCYDNESISNMPLSYLLYLLHAHQYLIQGELTRYEPINGQAFNLIKRGLDKFFGEESAHMVLRTLKLVYHMDEKFIISNPEIFEDTLGKMFKRSSKEMLSAISDEIKAELKGRRRKMSAGGTGLEQ